MSLATTVLLPAPGYPVIPITAAWEEDETSKSSAAMTSRSLFSSSVIRRETARTFPVLTCSTIFITLALSLIDGGVDTVMLLSRAGLLDLDARQPREERAVQHLSYLSGCCDDSLLIHRNPCSGRSQRINDVFGCHVSGSSRCIRATA